MSELADFFKKKLLPALFLGALLLLGARTCASESASAEIRFEVGEAGEQVRGVHAELYEQEEGGGQEMVGYFERSFERGSPAEAGRWPLTADAGLYLLVVDVTLEGRAERIERRIDLRDGAVVTVDLERDLLAGTPSG